MTNNSLSVRVVLSAYFLVAVFLFFSDPTTALHVGEGEEEGGGFPVPVPARHGAVVKKEDRWSVVTTEFGEISAVKVRDGRDGFYHLQFITMEPNSLFLPVHLHSDMVFYVDTGSGTLNWVDLENDDDKLRQVELQAGDVYRLRTGSFFYLQSNLESDRRKLRINAIFSDSREEIREGSSFGAYSSVRDLILGFDNRVLQAALSVDEEVIEELRSGGKQAMIVHGVAKAKTKELWEIHYKIMKTFLGRMKNGMIDINKKSKNKDKAYNILTADHDVENCNGWSLVVTSEQLDVLKDSDFSIFMVNLTKGAMMGPHWNPTTAEIGVVLRGRGMVHVVCPGTLNETECKNSRFRVEEGDVFVVPRYHPMAQMSFNNGSFVFMGFTTTTKKNHPQYLVGTASVLQVLDKRVVAASFGVSNTTMDEVLKAQREAIILECVSCAEEEERLMEEEIEREKEEEEAKRREEEEKRREEEEARRQEEEERREQEEARKREEEEARRREEEAARRQKEEEEEEARRQEEEERREQEEARKREEEEARRREEEEVARRQKEQEEEEEEARRQQEEEEAARRQQEEEEAARRQHEEEEARKQQEEAARRQEEEEAARRQQEEEAARRQQEEEAARRREEQEEEAKRRQEEARRRQEEEEEARRREEEWEAARGGGGRGQGEGEAASREEEEMARRQREAEAAARGRGGGQGNGSYEE
ncbi:hypothetical protein L2E82_43740 [Cichorium intybus]|uniref:Uncharacterized protein n=1 Tax=Cichorium intybus TaxID=13427 RepID=A0ACB8ZTI3_CICIN|nr:hypothetical protein L2E82_43740 [Cichorium intybus]